MIFLKQFLVIKQDYWLMLATLFFMKIGQFMLLPFLAIYLVKHTHLSPAVIGLVVGSGPFVYGIAGLGAGVLIDRFGVKKGMVWSLFSGGVTIFFFFYKFEIAWFLLINTLVGMTRAYFDVACKSYGVSGMSLDVRKLCFSLRFMFVNTSAAIGPVLGAYFALSNSVILFEMIGVIYFILSVLAIFILKENKIHKETFSNRKITFREMIQILLRDNRLQMLLLISFIIWFVYSQLDTTLGQHLNARLSNGIQIYSFLLIINAIGCALTQLIITQVVKNIDENLVSSIAMILFAIAYVIMAISLNVSALVMAAIIIVFAETSIMPINDLLIAKIAPPDRIATYYGAAGIAMLGLGVGPIIGGVIYQYLGAAALFLICSILCCVTILLYRKIYVILEHKSLVMSAVL